MKEKNTYIQLLYKRKSIYIRDRRRRKEIVRMRQRRRREGMVERHKEGMLLQRKHAEVRRNTAKTCIQHACQG